MKKIKGCGTAIITPFNNGEVDYDSYENLLKRQIGKIDFLVALGTTAETPCLEDYEKLELLRISAEYAKDLPLVIGCGSNSLSASLRNIDNFEQFRPSAYLIVIPYYNKPTQEGIYQYFKHISEYTDTDIIIYNVPSRTGSNIEAKTVLRLAEIPNIIGIKEASGNLEQIKTILDNKPEDFVVLSGNDDQTLDIIKMGGEGVISVVSNLCPDKMSSMTRYALNKEWEKAESIDKQLTKLYKDCFIESNPIPVKAGLSLINLCENELRLPLTAASPKTIEIMKENISLYE